jgi:glucosamine kinase
MSHPVLVADSGATKTDWRLIHSSNDIRPFQTNGFNPFFIDSIHINTEVDKDLVPYIDSNNIKEVFFYGAGCSSADRCVIVEDALIPLFPNARIEVENDLLGAARALCSASAGIACILGTGSNSCFFDGKNIIENIPSLGFMLGDEGSAAHIGKHVLKEVLTQHAPKEICDLFLKKYGYDRVEILKHIYQKPFPNRFLASFARFASENVSMSFFRELVKKCFDDFFQTQLLRYERCREVPVNFTGSVASVFSDILKEVAAENNITVRKIVQSPIDGLIEYHLNELKKLMTARFDSEDD